MKKRFLSILLSLCMVLALLPVTAFAEDNEEPTETPVCTCEAACSAEAMNADCPICGAEGATIENCGKYVAPVEETESEQTAVEKVQALIDALPDADTITEENRADVEAQLTAIDETKLPLGDELDALDFTKYNAAIVALNELDGMGGAEIPEMLEDTTLPDWVDNSDKYSGKYFVKSDKTNITLTGDVTLTGKMLVIDKDVTLNLNGYTLAVNGYLFSEDFDWEIRTLQINSGCTLTLTDSSEAKSGKLSLDNGLDFPTTATLYGTLNANGGTITADTYGIIQCTSGIIQCTGASATDFNILVDLYGGTISGGNFNRNVRAASGGTISGGMFYGDIDSSCTIANGSHKITFMNGSSTYATQVVASGKTTTEPREPKKAHFIFEGWIDENGTPYTFGSALTADVTLYANWTPAPLATVTKAPEAKTGLVFGSYDADLVTPGTAEGGQLVYRYTDIDGSFFVDYRDQVPFFGSAGTFKVWYKVAADDDHTDSAEYGPITVTVAPKKVTISGITAKNKVYDGTTDVELYGWRDVPIEGLVFGDATYVATVEGAFADADAGVGKTIVISKLTLGGDNPESYVFDMPVVTADITPKEVTVSGIRAEDKTYDGNTAATLKYDDATISGRLEGDTLTVSATGTFADKNVGEDRTVSISNLTLGGEDAGNYKLAASGQQTETTADITKKAVTLQSATASKAYDGTALTNETVTASGMAAGEEFAYDFTGTQTDIGSSRNTFTAKDSATAKPANYDITYDYGTLTVSLPANVGDAVKDMTVDTVTSDDRKTVEDTQKTVDDYLGMEPTESEKNTLNELKTKTEGLLDRLDTVKAAMEDEVITGTDGITKDNVKIADKKALTDAKAAIEKLLEDYSGNLTANEKQALNDKLERIGDALDEITRLEKAANNTTNKSPQTGDNSHMALWFALILLSGGALAGTAVYGKKRKHSAK